MILLNLMLFMKEINIDIGERDFSDWADTWANSKSYFYDLVFNNSDFLILCDIDGLDLTDYCIMYETS